jgi:peroxiredoxin family protein
MPTLGIMVSTDQYLDHLIGLTKAAKAKGHSVRVFLTNKGVSLPFDPKFSAVAEALDLEGGDDLALCNVGYEAAGYKGQTAPGIPEKGYATQTRHGEMIEECDAYINL